MRSIDIDVVDRALKDVISVATDRTVFKDELDRRLAICKIANDARLFIRASLTDDAPPAPQPSEREA